jgi:phosphoenolpyruvate carboxykinase (GTP)
VRRIDGAIPGVDSALGLLPSVDEGSGLNLIGLDLDVSTMDALFDIPTRAWMSECDLTEEFFSRFGDRLPEELTTQLQALRLRLTTSPGSANA